MNIVTQITSAPDFVAIKQKQNAAWASGDYSRIGITLQIVGEQLAEAVDPSAGASVLDVAAGNGNATLAFARRGANVTSTDYVGDLLARGRARAEADGLDVRFQIADAEALPFTDGEFDAVVSTFGVMFSPNQAQAAAELARVCRPGGRIGLANWTPSSFIGQLFKTVGAHVPPPAGVQSPALWGDENWLQTAFGASAASIEIVRRNFIFRAETPSSFVDLFRDYYGPVHKAFLALDETAREGFHDAIEETIDRFNVATDGSMRVPGEYLEVVITRA
ncbi:MAG: methyltransferase domain-containing protein [Rhizobiaceae bacterium]